MRDLLLDLAATGGLARTRSLVALGHSTRRLARAVESGLVARPRIGWVAAPGAEPAGIRAVRLGCRLTSSSALVSHGVWVDRVEGLVVLAAANASRLPPLGPGERRVWFRETFPAASAREWRVSVLDALLHFGHEHSAAALVASVDSALQLRLIGMAEVEALCAASHSRHRHLRRDCDGRAESGTESHLRLLLRAAGFRVESQASIPLVGRVDLLVDGWLIVELDSAAHHSDPLAQESDRIRDGNAILTGHATLRFMPEAVRNAPDWCLEVIRGRMRDGRPDAESGAAWPTRRAAS